MQLSASVNKEITQSGRTAPFYREDATPACYIDLAPALYESGLRVPRAYFRDRRFEARAKAAVRPRSLREKEARAVYSASTVIAEAKISGRVSSYD